MDCVVHKFCMGDFVLEGAGDDVFAALIGNDRLRLEGLSIQG